MTIEKELSKYKLHLMEVLEVRRNRDDTKLARKYTDFNAKGKEKPGLGRDFCCIREPY
jgi:hypothetical protein